MARVARVFSLRLLQERGNAPSHDWHGRNQPKHLGNLHQPLTLSSCSWRPGPWYAHGVWMEITNPSPTAASAAARQSEKICKHHSASALRDAARNARRPIKIQVGRVQHQLDADQPPEWAWRRGERAGQSRWRTTGAATRRITGKEASLAPSFLVHSHDHRRRLAQRSAAAPQSPAGST